MTNLLQALRGFFPFGTPVLYGPSDQPAIVISVCVRNRNGFTFDTPKLEILREGDDLRPMYVAPDHIKVQAPFADIKLFEIRDDATEILCVAIRFAQPVTQPDVERWYLERSGWGGEQRGTYLFPLRAGEVQYNPDMWSRAMVRTMPIAHYHIKTHWDTLCTGSVVDVEFILGERPEPKHSARLDCTACFGTGLEGGEHGVCSKCKGSKLRTEQKS